MFCCVIVSGARKEAKTKYHYDEETRKLIEIEVPGDSFKFANNSSLANALIIETMKRLLL